MNKHDIQKRIQSEEKALQDDALDGIAGGGCVAWQTFKCPRCGSKGDQIKSFIVKNFKMSTTYAYKEVRERWWTCKKCSLPWTFVYCDLYDGKHEEYHYEGHHEIKDFWGNYDI